MFLKQTHKAIKLMIYNRNILYLYVIYNILYNLFFLFY